MKKNIIFDIQFGASGDMLLGSLLDLGLDKDKLLTELAKLNLKNWSIAPEKTVKNHIRGTAANVKCKEDKHSRKLDDVNSIIQKSGLSDKIKKKILDVFQKLAIAESSVHGKDIDTIHFHEVGAIDAIIDISAFCISLDILEIDKFFFNDFCFGTGSVKSAHGELPVPVPAVVELTKNFKSKITDKVGENITPTAAAILTSLGKQIDEPTSFTLINNGYGFGARDCSSPNYTRAFLIKIENKHEEVQQLECNIDDMNPQVYPYIIEKLLQAGALDVYISQISMKKGRPGILLTVIAQKQKISTLKKEIYRNTTTLGLRTINVIREKLNRKFETVRLYDHDIKIKLGYLDDEIVNIQPEFEDCKKVSRKTDIPLKEIMAKTLNIYLSKNK